MRSEAFFYCFKIWVTTLAIGPIALDILRLLGMNHTRLFSPDSSALLLLMPVFGIISLPSVILAWLALLGISRYTLSLKVFKAGLSLIGLVLSELVIVPFAWNEPKSTLDLVFALASYQMVMVVCIWVYKFGITVALHQTGRTASHK